MGMQENDKLQIFEDQPIRTAWDEEREEWYFSVVDVVGALTESADPTAYWRKLKQRLKAEGNEGAVAKFFFAAALLLHPEHSISRPRLPVTAQIFILGHSKADRGIFPGLPVDNFLCSTTTKLFSQNNGFPACFFAASSTAS